MNDNQDLNLRLFLLYLIDKLPGQTHSDLVGHALSSLYLDYFSYNEHFSQLSEQGLIYVGYRKDDTRKDASGRSEERVYLTEKGRSVLLELMPDIPLPMRKTVDQLSQSSKEAREMKDNVSVSISAEHDGFYRLDCKLMQGGSSRMALSLLLPDEALCKKMALNWKSDSIAIYNDILARLHRDSVDEAKRNPET